MKKLFAVFTALALILALGMTASAACVARCSEGRGCGRRWSERPAIGKPVCVYEDADGDGDGICDACGNARNHCAFVDRDGDGVCDWKQNCRQPNCRQQNGSGEACPAPGTGCAAAGGTGSGRHCRSGGGQHGGHC